MMFSKLKAVLLQVSFISLRIIFFFMKSYNFKVIISTPIKRYSSKKASSVVVDDVIQQVQQLNTNDQQCKHRGKLVG